MDINAAINAFVFSWFFDVLFVPMLVGLVMIIHSIVSRNR